MTAYLRSRRLIAEDAAAPAEGQEISISEDFLMCGLVPLGSVLDLVALFLDTLETHYDLYDPAALPASAAHADEAAPTEAAY